MEDLNVMIAGAAGEGIQTLGAILAETVSAAGYSVFTWQDLESRIRGGQNSYSLRVGESPVNAPLTEVDLLLALNNGAATQYAPWLKEGGVMFAKDADDARTIALPFTEVAEQEFGRRIYGNTVATGALTAAMGLDLELLEETLGRWFSRKGEEVLEANRRAARRGYEMAQDNCRGACPRTLSRGDKRYHVLSANQAIPLGAACAGCRFMAAYPMSPSTAIITYLANEEDRLGVFTEQAEDEIAAINMAIGASFAGARAMTATSGGGFALMVEGISLAGMTEIPVVVVLAQRPGPATGLPTRTAQGDLLFAVNGGHGEFPKMVMAPSDPKDAFHKTVRAFNLADRFQVPVILLTDQFLSDSTFSIEDMRLEDAEPKKFLADPSTMEEYLRYRITEDGVSPRLYPGQSPFLVAADSDEHDEHGHITEDLAGTAVPMMEKRLAKLRSLQREVQPPEARGVEDARRILVGWGSSRGAVLEALELLKRDGVPAGMIHFTELWPLPDYSFPPGKQYVCVESNMTGQLETLLRSRYEATFQNGIRRYDGLPLTGEYIRRRFHDLRG